MSTPSNHPADALLNFWFADHSRTRWFNSTAEFDEKIRVNYEKLVEQAIASSAIEHDFAEWLETANACLALTILLDQFPLNVYRGQAKAFATEAKAVAVARHALQHNYPQAVAADQVAFFILPFMHSEDMTDQNLSVELATAHGEESLIKFSKHHRGIIEQFGRFPHRNTILHRPSTPQERDYLQSDQAFHG